MRISSISLSSAMTFAKSGAVAGDDDLRRTAVEAAELVSCNSIPGRQRVDVVGFAGALPVITKVSPTAPSVPPLTMSRPSEFARVAVAFGVPDERVVAGIAIERWHRLPVPLRPPLMVSLPAPALTVSLPPRALMVSLPAVPVSVLLPVVRHGRTAPASPSVKSLISMAAFVDAIDLDRADVAGRDLGSVSNVLPGPPIVTSITRVAKLAAVMPRALRSMRSWLAGVPPSASKLSMMSLPKPGVL